jgi:hypothetical protein
MAGELKYKNRREKFIDCTMKVHRKTGYGYNGYVYSKCWATEFDKAGILYKKEGQLPVCYDDMATPGESVYHIKCHSLKTGRLINFGAPGLPLKRLINPYKRHPLSNSLNPLQNPLNLRS